VRLDQVRLERGRDRDTVSYVLSRRLTHSYAGVALSLGDHRLEGQTSEGNHAGGHDAGAADEQGSTTDVILCEESDRGEDGEEATN
jgi:hypothetical protein